MPRSVLRGGVLQGDEGLGVLAVCGGGGGLSGVDAEGGLHVAEGAAARLNPRVT